MMAFLNCLISYLTWASPNCEIYLESFLIFCTSTLHVSAVAHNTHRKNWTHKQFVLCYVCAVNGMKLCAGIIHTQRWTSVGSCVLQLSCHSPAAQSSVNRHQTLLTLLLSPHPPHGCVWCVSQYCRYAKVFRCRTVLTCNTLCEGPSL